MRRGPVSLVAVCLGVALVVGVVAAIDLRRLQTPRGTALAWTGAAVFGDCTAYRELSIAPDGAGDEAGRCLELRRRTERARARAGEVSIELLSVQERADRAAAVVRVRRPEEPERQLTLDLRPRGDGWAVVLTDQTCAVLACP